MNQFLKDIADFHTKFGLEYNGSVKQLEPHMRKFRENFMQEELDEYISASELHDQLDALVDLVYVVLGTAYLQGFPFQEAWRRVHQANMKKVRKESERSEFDIGKPEGWEVPYLADLCDGRQQDLFIPPPFDVDLK